MPLLPFWKTNPEAINALSIEQIVATAGDGKLRDDSPASKELRQYLSEVQSEKLAHYADQCLSTPFPKSGLVLQDIVNELGRRLDYRVECGLYAGRVNAIGNDGLWRSPEGSDLLVEVKTTDAYRIPLAKIAQYRDRLVESKQFSVSGSMLIVVGREDTGELEAQIRGSRHAWDMRLISVDALARLVRIKESTEDPSTGAKIRSVLRPMEYTRLDALIDVLFTAAKDVESASTVEPVETAEADAASGWEFTDPKSLNEKRERLLTAFSRKVGVPLIRKSRAMYWDANHRIRAVCTVSKRYSTQGAVKYWYAYHPQWNQFLAEGDEGHFVLGCMDLSVGFAIPLDEVRGVLPRLNTTTTRDGATYWHVKILETGQGQFALQLPGAGHSLDLSPLSFPLADTGSEAAPKDLGN